MFAMNVNSCKLKIEKYFLETVAAPNLPYHFSDHEGVEMAYEAQNSWICALLYGPLELALEAYTGTHVNRRVISHLEDT